MVQVGAHVSISDGPQGAVEEQASLGGNVGQIFVGSPRTWSVSAFDEEDGEAFAEASQSEGMGPWIVHGTYLINFATPKDDLGKKSVTCLQDEIDACAKLGIPYYVFHPGSHTGAGVADGISNVADRLSELDVPSETTVLLENTSGKGTSLGESCAQLKAMAEESGLRIGEEVGYCLDSCHLFAAGYDFTSATGADELVEEAAADLGLDNIFYLHLNDSKHPLGSKKDEHEHIGEGEIGEQGFANLINHDAFQDAPMVLETPVGEKGYAWNIDKIKELANDA
jgi:deoxyribonuclease-4